MREKIASNAAMRTVENIRKQKRMKKSQLLVYSKSRTRYYEQMDADDIKVMTLKTYVNLMGCDLIVRDRISLAEWRV